MLGKDFGIILLVISVTLFSIIPFSFASTLFDESEQSLTREGVKWCEEKKPAFDRYGLDTLLRLEGNQFQSLPKMSICIFLLMNMGGIR